MKFNESVFGEFPVLKTPRLTLRGITAQDAKAIYGMRSNGRVNQFIARPNMDDEKHALSLAERTAQAFENRQAIGWAGVLRDRLEIIGTCGFNSIDVPNMHAEIGGEMATEYWGKHLAGEAFAVIVQFGLETMNLQTIEAKVSPDNRSAIHLMEQAGFVKEAHFKNRIYFNGEFLDMAVYTLHAGQFRL